mgnify:CR=1 FL=1
MKVGDKVMYQNRSFTVSEMYLNNIFKNLKYSSTEEINEDDYRTVMVLLTSNVEEPKKVHLPELWKPLMLVPNPK